MALFLMLLAVTPRDVTPCPRDGVAAQIPVSWSAPGAAQEFPCWGNRKVVKWDPQLLQRLEDDSVLASGSDSSIAFVLVGNQRYQPGCCTQQAVPQSFYAKVHSRTVLFLDMAMSESLAEGGRIWMEEIRQGSTPRLSKLGEFWI